MREAAISVILLAVGVAVGLFFKPNEAQSRPLEPTAGAQSGHDDHHH